MMLTGALTAAFAGAMMKAGDSKEKEASATDALTRLIASNLFTPAAATTLAALTAAGFAVVVAGNGGLPVFRSEKDGSIATVLTLPRA